MAFIKDSINVKIFILVAIVVVGMVALVFVFSKNFDDINTRYSEKLLELNQTFDELSSAQSELNSTMEDLELKSLREEDLKGRYSSVKTQRDNLERKKNRLMGVVSEKEDEIVSLQMEIDDLEDEIAEKNRRIDDLREDLAACEA